MAAITISKASLPVSSFGRGAASKPAVGIGDNGQIRMSTLLTADVVGKCSKAVITFDDATRVMTIRPVLTAPKGMTEEDLFAISRGKDGESKQAFFGAGPLLSHEMIAYDYKASGSQVFDCEIGTTKSGTKYFTFTLPKGAITPRPKKARTAPATAPTPAKNPGPVVEDDEID